MAYKYCAKMSPEIVAAVFVDFFIFVDLVDFIDLPIIFDVPDVIGADLGHRVLVQFLADPSVELLHEVDQLLALAVVRRLGVVFVNGRQIDPAWCRRWHRRWWLVGRL